MLGHIHQEEADLFVVSFFLYNQPQSLRAALEGYGDILLLRRTMIPDTPKKADDDKFIDRGAGRATRFHVAAKLLTYNG